MNSLNDSQVDRLVSKNQDMHGRRIVNAGASVDQNDYVTRAELPSPGVDFAAIKQYVSNVVTKALGFLTINIRASGTSKNVLQVDGGIRVENDGYPSTGVGLELGYSTAGYIRSYDRDAAAYKDLNINAKILTVTTTGNSVVSAAGNFNVTAANSTVDVAIGTFCPAAGSVISIGSTTSLMAFYNGTPVIQQVLNAYTHITQSVVYTGIATGAPGSVYAAVSDVNNLRAAYENLRTSYDDLRTKLLASTLVG